MPPSPRRSSIIKGGSSPQSAPGVRPYGYRRRVWPSWLYRSSRQPRAARRGSAFEKPWNVEDHFARERTPCRTKDKEQRTKIFAYSYALTVCSLFFVQIGRASCRERVYISEVTVSL